MTPSPKPPAGDRTQTNRRRAMRAGLAALLIVTSLVAVRIGSNDNAGSADATVSEAAAGHAPKVKNANYTDTKKTQSKKGTKSGHWVKNGWTKTKGKATGPAAPPKSGSNQTTAPTPAPTAPATTAPTTPARPAPTTPPRPTPTPAPPSGGSQGLQVDLSRLPGRASGWGNQRIGSAAGQPRRSDGVGAFRINCGMSHMNFDDPIVAPGRVGASHLHMFFGNTGVDAYSNSSSIANSGNSTCTGGTANRSAYWTPAVIDTRTNAPVLPWNDPVPWLANNGVTVYYKTGYRGVPSASVQNPPAGLRMIAGSASRTTAGSTIDPATPRYWCKDKTTSAPYNTGSDLNRNCRPGHLLVMTIQFPQCWNGRDLDSPNHQSHMAYGTWGPTPGRNGAGCPPSHPVALPEVTINVNYEVPAGGTSTWRLSSDMYDGPGGYSGHADWWNGWDRNVFQQVVDNCYRPGLDCQMNLLGGGRALN